MTKTLRFSHLSASWQALVRLCQDVNHGSIEGLEFRNSEPLFNPKPVILRDIKLDKYEPPRLEFGLEDFALSAEVLRFMDLLGEMKCGSLRHIEVRAGIPRRILVASQGLADPKGSAVLPR